MSAVRMATGVAVSLLLATGTGTTVAQHGGHGGGHAGGHVGGHMGGHIGGHAGFGHVGGVPHAMHAAPLPGRVGVPIGRINHPANGSFGRVGIPMTHHLGNVGAFHTGLNGAAFRGGLNGTAFRGTSNFALPRPSTPYRLTIGTHGYRVSYPTRGTSVFFGYGGFPFFGYGGYPYLGFGLGYSNFGYPLSYPYGYGGYFGNYGGYYGGYVSPAMYAIGGGTALATGPSYQPLPQAFVPGPMPGEAPAGAPAPPGAATVTVIVPEGGQVWFDNNLLQKGGTKWVYTSPALEAGKTYTITVKARWSEGGKDASLELPVKIRAGDELTIDVNKLR